MNGLTGCRVRGCTIVPQFGSQRWGMIAGRNVGIGPRGLFPDHQTGKLSLSQIDKVIETRHISA